MYSRRYRLRRCALELSFADDDEDLFVVLLDEQQRQMFWRKLRSLPLPLLTTGRGSIRTLTPRAALRRAGLTERWRRREICNFEYLMHLNNHSGRTYNDITQYYIFPWILSDYASEELHLKKKRAEDETTSVDATFRDLSKPVGALNEARLSNYVERYEAMASSYEDASSSAGFATGIEPPFLFGTHYSSPAVALHYLTRLAPYTSMAVALQGGQFDVPDRLFHDIAASFSSSTSSMGDVRELVPELYYQPAALTNHNNLPLGTTQSGLEVGDVNLPKWASSPHEFVRLMRIALESEHVSANLHSWIDLIFGAKQRGQAAIDAHNLFHYLTYEGAVDLDAIADPVARQAACAQIAHFGQTPAQVFLKPHPARLPRDRSPSALFTLGEAATNVDAARAARWLKPQLVSASAEAAESWPSRKLGCTEHAS